MIDYLLSNAFDSIVPEGLKFNPSGTFFSTFFTFFSQTHAEQLMQAVLKEAFSQNSEQGQRGGG
jgi:hypothetical protein